jgi:hypothetical protein
MYTRRYGVKYYLHAHVIQLYISLDSDNELKVSFSLNNLEHLFADIWLWMTQNLLKLNENKTYIIYLASPLFF